MDALDTLDIQSMPADRAVAGTATAATEAKMTAESADPAWIAGIVASARIAVLVVAVALTGVAAAGSGIAVAVQTAASAAAQRGIAGASPGIVARMVEP